MRKIAGFTLAELLVVVVVLGIMGGLAVPMYRTTVEQGRANEAKVNLNIILMGEKLFRLNNGNYWRPGGTTIAAANTNLGVDMTAVFYTDITVDNPGGDAYRATLTRTGGTKWFRHQYTNGAAAPVPTEGGAY